MADVSGDYYCSPVGDVGYILELKKDSTFLYNWGFDLAQGETEGTWVLQNNVVILNSYKQADMLFTILKAEERNIDSLVIRVFDVIDTTEIFYAECCVKYDSIELCNFTAFDGFAKFTQISADSLFIRHIAFAPIKFKIYNKNYNYYEFTMEDSKEKFYKYFTNKSFLYRDNKLVDREFRSNEFMKQ